MTKDTSALALMLMRSGKSADGISKELGKSRNWLRMAIRDGNRPRLDTVAAVASVTGHEVAILDAESGEVVAIVDAPKPDVVDRGQSDSAGSD